jgi:hypothetical protein
MKKNFGSSSSTLLTGVKSAVGGNWSMPLAPRRSPERRWYGREGLLKVLPEVSPKPGHGVKGQSPLAEKYRREYGGHEEPHGSFLLPQNPLILGKRASCVFRTQINQGESNMSYAYRPRECLDCKWKWYSKNRYSSVTPNLSGEATEYCPICGSRSVVSGPQEERKEE